MRWVHLSLSLFLLQLSAAQMLNIIIVKIFKSCWSTTNTHHLIHKCPKSQLQWRQELFSYIWAKLGFLCQECSVWWRGETNLWKLASNYTTQWWTLHSLHYALYSTRCTMYSKKCTMNSVQCTLKSVHWTVYIKQCTVYRVQCTVNSVHCTVYSIHHRVLRVTERPESVPCHRNLSLHPFPVETPEGPHRAPGTN